MTDDVEHNYVHCIYAVVNPHGKNKEQAVAYLEAAAVNMLASIKRPAFVQKDISSYDGYFDMSMPIYQDIYTIFRDAAVITKPSLSEDYHLIVQEYQNNQIKSARSSK